MRLGALRFMTAGFSAAALLLSSPISRAQLEPVVQTGSRIAVKPVKFDPVTAGAMRKEFGRCLLHLQSDVSTAIMNHSDPLKVDWEAVGIKPKKFSTQSSVKRCVGLGNGSQWNFGITVSDSAFRAVLLEESYLLHSPAAPSLPEGAQEQTGRRYVSTGDDLPRAQGLGQFADCIAFKDTQHADALVRTKPATKDEQAAAQALVPILGVCLVQGQTLSMTPANIRALAADGLWTRYVRSSTIAQGK